MTFNKRTTKPPKAPPKPIIGGDHTYASLTDKIGSIVLTTTTPRAWFIAMGIASMFLMLFLVAVTYLFAKGVGIWGLNVPVAWGFAIVNFVWWVGIGHAGTFISAILLLLHQEWRTSINRFAESMTLFAVACAGLFPLLHLGRPWKFYYLMPYPNTLGLWPQFQSPLVWDVFAVTTYLLVSLLFWFTGLVPDMSTMRDRAKHPAVRVIFGILSLGWRGSSRHWHRYQMAYLLLAGLATPLVLSVHSIVSLDFASGIIPGWHTTMFPPYFVAGAIFSGFAMVLTLVLPIRALYHLEDLITDRHVENMAKIMLATGLMVAFGYVTEAFMAWYAGGYEQFMMWNRITGPYSFQYWMLVLCNIITPQFLWFKRIRTNWVILFILALVINTGMWLERFVIVVTSLHRDFLPSSWGMYRGTFWDWATFLGTLGFFFMCMFLFIRLIPAISGFEMRELLHKKKSGH